MIPTLEDLLKPVDFSNKSISTFRIPCLFRRCAHLSSFSILLTSCSLYLRYEYYFRAVNLVNVSDAYAESYEFAINFGEWFVCFLCIDLIRPLLKLDRPSDNYFWGIIVEDFKGMNSWYAKGTFTRSRKNITDLELITIGNQRWMITLLITAKHRSWGLQWTNTRLSREASDIHLWEGGRRTGWETYRPPNSTEMGPQQRYPLGPMESKS